MSTSITTSSSTSPAREIPDAVAATVRAWTQRSTVPAPGEETTEATASGSTFQPASLGVSPWTAWKYRPMSSTTANRDIVP
ncbi:MAG TPA: hypothetical protein VHH34_11155, partial [Pseudonocardiaceae bacterium]|nr:hypothetical protein [Pseudonocardiaceae bacterium]